MVTDAVRKLKRARLKERLYERRFLLPNAVTVGNMFCGFLSMIYSSSGRYEKACIAIFIAIVLDGIDGRVARRFNATSKFGVEYDSFSDLISFGVAPAALMYHWAFKPIADEFGVLVSFFYAVCAASRLARFNISTENLTSFMGLPSPGAAVFIVSLVFLNPTLETSPLIVTLCTLSLVSIGYLMVSKIEFLSIKKLKLARARLVTRLVAAVSIALIWYYPKSMIFAIACIYAMSGPVKSIMKKRAAVKEAVVPPAVP